MALFLASTQMPRGGTTHYRGWHDASLPPQAQGKRKGGPGTEPMSYIFPPFKLLLPGQREEKHTYHLICWLPALRVSCVNVNLRM